MKKISLLLALVLMAAPALAQPTVTNVSPGYGGTGPNSAGTWTLTGTGFSTATRATRFVDANNADVFINVACGTTTSCAAGLRPSRVPTGSAQTLGVFALVNGVKSASTVNFLYYGEPTFTSVIPSSSAANVDTAGNVNGGPFTTGGAAFGDTTVILYLYVHDYTSGCTSGSQCGFTAMSPLLHDCCQSQGAYPLSVYTPGGVASSYFTFGTAPATPTIASIVPSSGPVAGGTQTVTITGTNFLTSGVGTTSFTFITHGSFGTSNLATSVSCSSTTTCTAKVPNGGSGGLADVQVQTLCNAGQACAGTRSSQGIPSTKIGVYAYAGLAINPGGFTQLNTSENGQSAQFSVVLNSQPTANVHVAVNGGTAMVPSSGGRATLSPTGLDFTVANWNQPQTVTVTGIDDTGTGVAGSAAAPGTGNVGYSVGTVATSTDLNYNGVNGADQQLVNLDNDSANVFIAPVSGLVTTRKGQNASFKIVLTKAPTSPVTIGFTSNDPLEGSVSPASLTFATTPGGASGWNVVQTVTVTGLGLGAVGRDMPYGIITTLTSADAAYTTLFTNFGVSNVAVTNTDGLPPPGDFNIDGKSDLVWRNYGTGENAIWYMNGTTPTSAATFNSAPANWSIIGTGDFDGNGKADIVWRNTVTGENAIWYMNGSVPTSSAAFSSAPTDWAIVGIGDFNGDGKPDIVWRNTVSGADAIWYMNNTAIIGGGAFSSATTDWAIVGAGDFNGDGKADIVWRNTVSGANAIWYMNGLAIIGGGAFAGAPTNWTLGAVGDFNGDGSADVVWRNMTTGENAVWFMNGLNIIGGGAFNSAPTTWSIVGPR